MIALSSAEPRMPLRDAAPERVAPAVRSGPAPWHRKLVSIGIFVALVPIVAALSWAFDYAAAAIFGAFGALVAAGLRTFFEHIYADD